MSPSAATMVRSTTSSIDRCTCRHESRRTAVGEDTEVVVDSKGGQSLNYRKLRVGLVSGHALPECDPAASQSAEWAAEVENGIKHTGKKRFVAHPY